MKLINSNPGSECELFEYVHDLDYSKIPADVIHQAKRALLDNIAAMIAGRRTEYAKGMEWIAKDGINGGTSTVIGSSIKTHCIRAALINGAYSQVHDFNDGFEFSGYCGGSYHPGRVLIPTALAIGERVHASGKMVLAGLVAGYDVSSRIRNPEYHHIPLPDAYGSAAVASRLLSWNIEQIKNAFGIAAYLAPNRCNLRGLHFDADFIVNGAIAQAGIQGALLAGQGMTGPVINDDINLARRFTRYGLGSRFEIMTLYFKPYPTCRKTHSAIDMALAFRAKGIKPGDIQVVNIYQNCEGMYINTHVDANSNYRACEYNIHYPVACAFIDGRVGVDQFNKEHIARTEVQSLIKKITVIGDQRLDDAQDETKKNISEMRLVLKDGQVLNLRVEHPLGDAVNPLTDEGIESKLADCANGHLDRVSIRRLADFVWNLDNVDDITKLFDYIII